MNEQTTKLLEQLAQKLGTTVEYLWGVLIQQAYVDAIINIGYLIFIIVVWICMWKLDRYFTKKGWYTKDNDSYEWFMIIATLILAGISIKTFLNIEDIVTGFVNPEYWALQQVMKLI